MRSKTEQRLEAIKGLLETMSGAGMARNTAAPGRIPPGGLIAVRDGDPAQPEQALGGFGGAGLITRAAFTPSRRNPSADP